MRLGLLRRRLVSQAFRMRYELIPQRAVRCKNVVISRQVSSWLGRQRNKPGDKVHRLKYDVHRAISINSRADPGRAAYTVLVTTSVL
jgi:hypothetical protein